MHSLRWWYLLLGLAVAAFLHGSVALVWPVFAQVPAVSGSAPGAPDTERLVAHARSVRDKFRAEAQQMASATCANAGRYEDDLLILQFGRLVEVFRDRFEVDQRQFSWESTSHVLEGCNDELGISVVRLMRYGEGDVAGVGLWKHLWIETILVHQTRWGRLQLRWLGTPLASPDQQAIASCEIGQPFRAYHGIHIAVRDEKRGWSKLWQHLPSDLADCEFIRWEGPSRFRVLMYDNHRVVGGGNRWESVIEFTPTTLTRTDGPKTPTKHTPEPTP